MFLVCRALSFPFVCWLKVVRLSIVWQNSNVYSFNGFMFTGVLFKDWNAIVSQASGKSRKMSRISKPRPGERGNMPSYDNRIRTSNKLETELRWVYNNRNLLLPPKTVGFPWNKSERELELAINPDLGCKLHKTGIRLPEKTTTQKFLRVCVRVCVCTHVRARSKVRNHTHTHTHTHLSLIHIWRCRRDVLCRSRWAPDH